MASEAVASLQAACAGPWLSALQPILLTLRDGAATSPELVVTLSGQLSTLVKSLPKPAPGAVTAAAPPPVAPAALDLSNARFLRGVNFLSPRGKFDVALLPDRLALLSPKAAAAGAASAPPALSVAYTAVEGVLALEKPPDTEHILTSGGVKNVWYIMLPLAPDSPAEYGKQRLTTLLLSCSATAMIPLPTARGGGAAAEGATGPAPEVLADALCSATGKAPDAPSPTSFRSSKCHGAVGAHVKVNPGLLFCCRTGLAFVTASKSMFLPVGRWDGVTIGRAGGGFTNTSFDLKVGSIEFGMIARDELAAVQEYIASRTRALERQQQRLTGAAAAPEAKGEGEEKAAAAAAAAGDEGGSSSESDEDDESFRAEGSGDDSGDGSGEEDDSEDGGGWGMVATEEQDGGESKKARVE